MHPFARGPHTESAGTEIIEVIPAYTVWLPLIRSIRHTAGIADHIGYVMKAVGVTATTHLAESGDTDLRLREYDPATAVATGADEDIATDDFIAWRDVNGNYHADKVQALTGNSVSLVGSLSLDVPVGSTVWTFGQLSRPVHIPLHFPQSETTTYTGIWQAGWAAQQGINSRQLAPRYVPLLLVIDNDGDAGTLESVGGEFTRAPDIVVG